MQENDYYEILGVERDATPQQIRAAYRKLAFEYHPDRNRGDEAAERMKRINEAYAVLSHPQKKKPYDELYRQYGSSAHGEFRQHYSEQDIFRGSDIQHIFEELSRAFGFRGSAEVFREYYGTDYRSFEFQRPGFFGRVFVSTSFPRKKQSEGGRPLLSGNLYRLLNYGLRKRWGIELPEKGRDRYDIITISPDLARKGGKIAYLCRVKAKELIVTLPFGLTTGKQIRLRGMGDKGKGGAEPGDLYLKVRVRKSFRQWFKDLLRKLLKSS